jgi:hypothetical protein
MTTGPERERTFRSAGDELGSKLWEMSRSNTAVEPMTLGHMRRNGVHSLLIACQKCRHEVVMTRQPLGR